MSSLSTMRVSHCAPIFPVCPCDMITLPAMPIATVPRACQTVRQSARCTGDSIGVTGRAWRACPGRPKVMYSADKNGPSLRRNGDEK